MTPQSPLKGLDIGQAIASELVIHQNIKQEIVFTTVDKLKICLMDHEKHLASSKEWVGPAGLFISLVTTLVAARFENVLLEAEVWQAVYIISSILTLGWTIVVIRDAVRAKRAGGLDALIERIVNRVRPGTFALPGWDEIMRSVLEAPPTPPPTPKKK